MPTSLIHIAAHLRRRAVATCQRLGCSSEEGQSLVMASFCIVAMFFVAAMLVDGGMGYTQRRVMQNAADAGVLAGARQMAMDIKASDGEIYDTVNEYAVTRNGAKSFEAFYLKDGVVGDKVGHGSRPTDADGLVVNTQTDFATFFGKLLGQAQMTVVASAKATTGAILSPGPNVQPLAKLCDQGSTPEDMCGLKFGESYNIWDGAGTGNFGWLSFDGENNAGYLAEELIPGQQQDYVDPHGQCTELRVGCWVQGMTGDKNSSSVRDQLEEWKKHPDQPMIIIIYDTSEGQGANLNYRIVGFAAFELQSYHLPQGGGKGKGGGDDGGQIIGKFVQWVMPGQVDDSAGNFGVVSFHLSR